MRDVSFRAFARCTVQAVLATSLCLAPLVASAQDDPNAAPAMQSAPTAGAAMMKHHHHGQSAMWTALNLTDDQKAKMKAIHQKFKSDHAPGTATKADWKAQREQIEAVLTPDQLAQMKKWHAQHHHMMKHPHPTQMPTVAP